LVDNGKKTSAYDLLPAIKKEHLSLTSGPSMVKRLEIVPIPPVAANLLELPSFSGVSLSKTVTVDITLDILGELRFKVDYKPTIKVVPTMLTTASASVAAIINSNRRLQITVKGYISDPASIITIGDVIELKGSVV